MSSLAEAGIEVEINFRVKRYYSIYQKLRRQQIDISELYDYLAFRIVTTNLRDTYARARHGAPELAADSRDDSRTTSRCPSRTSTSRCTRRCWDRRGSPSRCRSAPARWTSSPRRESPRTGATRRARLSSEGVDKSVLWLRQLLEFQTDVSDPRHFLSGLKLDLYQDEVYVFSPKGDVLAFPRDAMPLDFAYRIHTDLGHRCTGARVNGRLVPLRTPLKTGDIVEILTSPSRVPSRDWLSLVVTSRAKHKIRHWLNTQQTAQATDLGPADAGARAAALPAESQEGAREPGVPATDGGGGALPAGGSLRPARLRQDDRRPGDGVATAAGEALRAAEAAGSDPQGDRSGADGRAGRDRSRVRGYGDLLAVPAKCCRPVPGDEIVGYITRGRGVSVHSVDCPNVKNLLYNAEREIEVAWATQEKGLYPISLLIETEDKPGMLARLTEAIARFDANIRQIEADTARPGRGSIEVVIEVANRAHFERIRQAVRNLPGVLEVTRRMAGSAKAGEEAF